MSKLARMLAALLLVSIMLSSTMSSVLADTDLEIGGLAIVANTGGDAVMVRDGAGYEYTVLLAAAAGTILTVTDGPYAGADGALWYEVNLDGTIGYIYADFLVLPENAPANPGGGGGSQPASSGDGYYLTISGTGGDGARMRDGADLDAAIILVIPEGASVEVLGSPDYGDGYAWYPVAYAGAVGWVAGIFLGDGSAPVQSSTTESAPGGGGPVFAPGTHVRVSGTGGENLRIRETYGLDGDIYGAAPSGAVLAILHGPEYDGAGNSWYAVDYDGLSGYSIADYLSWTDEGVSGRRPASGSGPAPATESAPAPRSAPVDDEEDEPSSNVGRGQAIVNAAMRYLGYPYVWAGSSPSGFDCSGFTMYVADLAIGYRLGRDTTAQVAAGAAVSADSLQPGDLVFFQNTYRPGLSHVGIYIGGGQMIGAASERSGVAIANIWDSYWGPRFYAARRL